MNISLNWLKTYIDIEDITPDRLSDLLTMAGLEVEAIEDQSAKFNGFVVGHVREHGKHPNADKLSVCQVFDGTETRQVVCGAPNVAAGQKIILAVPGAVVPSNGMQIGKAKLRGVESTGMICSERELELSEDHSGIMVLDDSFEAGTPAAKVIHRDDVIFEIGITPNRPDALSHIGVARDLAALLNRELKMPALENEFLPSDEIKQFASIEIHDYENCPRYSGTVIKNVTVKESPQWLKTRLEAIGLRPINNVVDVTNFILHELGQPLHAFDLDMLDDKKIIVKKAGADLKFTTLDSKERSLHPDALMICDGKKAVAVAGVMGGENSEVTEKTKNILIESAYFRPGSVRKTSKHLSLSTDASYRFERGTNPAGTLFAAQHAAELIARVSGGEIVPGYFDEKLSDFVPLKTRVVFSKVNDILGYEVPAQRMKEIVEKLGFGITASDELSMSLTIPPYRPDIEREIDVVEEIARIFGYNEIPAIQSIQVPMIPQLDETEAREKLRNFFISAGFYEIISNSLVNRHLPGLAGREIKLLNPQSADMASLRTSLVTGLLTTVQKNIFAGERDLKLFELGKVFVRNSDMVLDFSDFEENEVLGVVLTGRFTEKEWHSKERFFDIYDIKGYIDSFLEKFRLSNTEFSFEPGGNDHIDHQIVVKLGKNQIITGGRLKKDVLKQFDIEQEVFYLEVDVDKIKDKLFEKPLFNELLKYPKVFRDFAFVFDKQVDAAEVEKFIRKNGSSILKKAKLFDVFESKQLGDGKKSMAFAMEFYDENRTLTDADVEKVFTMLIEKIKNNFQAVLRG